MRHALLADGLYMAPAGGRVHWSVDASDPFMASKFGTRTVLSAQMMRGWRSPHMMRWSSW